MIKENKMAEKKVTVTFAMCAYNVKHETTGSMIPMLMDFARDTNHGFYWMAAWDSLICSARGAIVDTFLKTDSDYLMFLDSDMVFPMNMARKLVENAIDNNRAVVSGFYAMRNPPHLPLAMIDTGSDDPSKRYELVQPSHYGPSMAVDATGLGCCLIRRDVFETLERPLFVQDSGYVPGHNGASEDTYFFQKVRAAGIEIWIDTSVCCGHVAAPAIVNPSENSPCPVLRGRNHIYADAWRDLNLVSNQNESLRKGANEVNLKKGEGES